MLEHKIGIIGCQGVGSTSIVKRIVIDYAPIGDSDEYIPTIEETNTKKVVVEGRERNLVFLDTVGEEEFTTFRDHVLMENEGFIVVFSVTEKKSFKEATEYIEVISRAKNKEIKDIPIVLCGNKIDLVDEREVESNDINSVSENYSIPCIETSAKNYKNIDELVDLICKEFDKKKRNENAVYDEKKCCRIL